MGTNAGLVDSVTKVSASDGSIVGSYPVGDGPIGVVYDGQSLWVAGFLDGTVTQLGRDGSLLGSYPTAPELLGMGFDGVRVWAVSQLGSVVKR